jgi:hypothetical protein
MKKLTAIVDALFDGDWAVTVTDDDTGETFDFVIEAETEKEAAFKAMEQVNGY